MFPMTTWVKRLLIANIAMYFVSQAVPMVYSLMVLYAPQVVIRPWSLVTYMFLHGSLGHLFFNMIGLYFFGPRLETRLGARAFLWLYFISGIGGALFQAVFSTAAPMVGASGAIFGLLAAYAYFWPREKILVMLVIPMEIWLAVTLYIGYSLYAGMGNVAGGIAHFAHLGGAAVGFAFLKWWEWQRGAGKRDFQRKLRPDASPGGFVGDRVALSRWKGISIGSMHELNREEVVRLLAKAESEGAAGLKASEREFLDRMSTP